MRLRHTTHARDAALGQLERANRWLVVGSVALTGVFAELAAHAFSGHKTAGAKTSAHGHTAGHKASTTPLKPPADPPASATEPQISEAEREQRRQSEIEEPASPETAPAEPSQTPSEAAPPEPHVEAPAETHEEAPAQEAPVETAPPVVSGGS